MMATRLSTPQRQQVHAQLRDGRSWPKPHQTVSPAAVIRHLHPLIRGGAMDERQVVCHHTVQHVDDHLWRARWRWAKRRHPRTSPRWMYRRSFAVGQDGATF